MIANPRLLVILSLASTLASCNGNSNSADDKEKNTVVPGAPPVSALVLDKLVGTWQRDDGKSFERWTRQTDGSFRSVVYKLQGADTAWEEQADVYLQDGRWVFENKVTGQNDGNAVRFTSVSIDENSVHFSNPAHDFPTDVNYTMPDRNTIHAYIAGPNEKGSKDTIPFNYTRHD